MIRRAAATTLPVATLAGLVLAATPQERWSSMGSFRQAHDVVTRAVAAMGGPDALVRAGGLALDGEGILDLGTLLQGRTPFQGDPHSITERVALLPGEDRLVHEAREPTNPDAWSHRRVDYRAGGTYRIDLETGRASWTRPANRTRLERTVPHLLLAEVLDEPRGLRYLGTLEVDGGAREAVAWSPPGGEPVTLLFDPETGYLREAESLADLPVRGDARVRWSFLPYRDVPALGPYPTGYAIHVDDERLREVRWTRRTASPSGGILDPPEAVDLPEPTPFEDDVGGGPGPGSGAGDTDRSEDPFDIRELASGVHLLVHLRTGFHMLFVEVEEYVVAVDAPSGWWELQELPPRNWAGGASPDLGERYVRGIRSVVGDKPIRYVVLTHHHGDHAGGVRAFVKEGATVVAHEIAQPVVEHTLQGTLRLAGRPSETPPALSFETVDAMRTLGDGPNRVRILDVGDNPHARGMLAVWLPGPEILYVSDLFDPWGGAGAPSRDRLPVMRWFVDWLDGSGLEPQRIYAVHGAGRITEEHLETIRAMADTVTPPR